MKLKNLIDKIRQWKFETLFIVTALFILLFPPGDNCRAQYSPAAGTKQSINLAMPVDSRIGATAAQMVVFYENMAKIMAPKLKIPINIVRVTGRDNSWENEITDLLFRGKADLGFLPSRVLVESDTAKKTAGFVPMATFTVDNSPYLKDCLYVRKKDKITSIKGLKGKTWAGNTILETRRILLESGMDKPMDRFFGKIVPVANSSVANLGYLLLSGTIDAFTGTEIEMRLTLSSDSSLRDIAPLSCSKGALISMIVARPGMDPKILDRIERLLFNAHNDPDFKTFKWIFAAINGKIVPIETEYLDRTKKIYKTYEQKGWNKEEKLFQENFKK